MISPHILLPLAEPDGTTEVTDSGSTGATFTVHSGTTGLPWATPGWFEGDSTSTAENCLYSDDAAVLDVVDILTAKGVLFLSMLLTEVSGTSSILTIGSAAAASSGLYLYSSNSTPNKRLSIGLNPVGATGFTGRFLCIDDAWPISGNVHLAMLLDFAHGEIRTWKDGKVLPYVNADRDTLFNTDVANASGHTVGDGTVGLTLMSRFDGTTAGARDTTNLVNAHNGAVKNFFAANLTDVENPWREAHRCVKALYAQRNTVMRSLPNIVSGAW